MEEQLNTSNPLLSVCLITYNHDAFIEQTLEGILKQEVNFPIEIIVADDASTDTTNAMLDKYISQNPTQFKRLSHDTNLGMHKNWERAIRACEGKYVALLEGDDCWTDPLKLQKQVDILEADPTLSICCTNARVELVGSAKPHPNYVEKAQGTYTLADLIQEAFMPTCTVVFKNRLLPPQLPPCYYKAPMADYPIHLLNAMHGAVFYINEVSATYRLHAAGEWGRLNTLGRLKHILGGIQCAQHIITQTEFQKAITQTKKDTLFKIASLYKNRRMFAHYLYYRVRTRLAI